MAPNGQQEDVARPNMEKHNNPNPIEYGFLIYQKRLQYQRLPFTFKPLEWEAMAEQRMPAESKGYVVGNAGTGETARKNREAFSKWSIMPSRLVRTEGFPDMSVNVLGQQIPFPMACKRSLIRTARWRPRQRRRSSKCPTS